MYRFIIIVILLSGCKSHYSDYLKGDWYRVDDYILVNQEDLIREESKKPFNTRAPRPFDYYPFGFSIHSGDSVVFYPELWEEVDEKWIYKGENGRYLATKDSIWLQLPSESNYSKIYFWNRKGKDTMELVGPNGSTTFKRFFTEIKYYQELDSIRQYISNGWGYLEEKAVSRSGKTEWFRPLHGEPQLEHFIGSIGKDEFLDLEHRYNWAAFMTLGDYSDCCDGRMIETVFYSKGKEVKRVRDYENGTPMRYLWASSLMSSYVQKSADQKVIYDTTIHNDQMLKKDQ